MKTEDQLLPTGSIIHWSEGYVYKNNGGNAKANVTCGLCKNKRYITVVKSAKWTGLCRQCANGAVHGSRNSNYRNNKIKRFGGYNFLLISCLSEEDQKLAKQMITHKSSYNSEWGYVAEHRLVMAKSLNRPLTSKEIVHHLNEIKDDNRLENLTLTNQKSHAKEHQSILKASRSEIQRLQKLLKANNVKY